MRVSFLSTGFLRGPDFFLRPGGRWRYGDLPMTIAVIERPQGLAVIDTGFSLRAALRPTEFPGRVAKRFLALRLSREETLVERLPRLGYSPRDVRDIALTHLHVDHAGGLEDFPLATVHVSAAEHALVGKRVYGYRPAAWKHGVRWAPFDFGDEAAFGFARSRDLLGDGSVIALDARGHTAGHTAFALAADGGPVIHAGDALFHLDEARQRKSCLYLKLLAHDRAAAATTRHALAELLGSGVPVIPSHDLEAFRAVETPH